MGFRSTLLGALGFSIRIPIGLLAGYFFFIYRGPTAVKVHWLNLFISDIWPYFLQAAIFPVVQKQRQLLVMLLLCNAATMEALPVYLDKIFHPSVVVVLSVTFVLTFGEIIPEAICSRYGLAVGANFVGLVHILMIICYPIAYPIGKVAPCRKIVLFWKR